MAPRFFRALLVCAVIGTFFGTKTEAQIVSIANVSGVVEIPHSLHVKDPEDAVVPRGQPLTLRCNVRTFPPGAAHQLRISWLHDNVPVPNNDSRRIQQKDGSLFIPRVTAGRRPLTGRYRCRVQNGVGVMVSGEAKVQIASLDFDVTEVSIEVAEYQAVVLPCHAQSVPEAKVRWDLNKQSLPHDSRYVPLPSGALLIFKSLLTDTGIYRCIVTNNVLKRSKNKIIRLTVLPSLVKEEKVSFLSFLPLNSTVTLGMRATLFCLANGWPLPKIDWLKDDVVVSNTSVLNITNADQATGGTYTCRARNSHDTRTRNYTLNVQQKPYFTTTPKSKSYTSAGTVKLECTAGGYPEPCIQWYKNGQRLRLGGRIKKKDGVLVMTHTFTYDSGIYQCVASNSAGSIWTSAQVVLTSPDPPLPPANVQCRSYDEKSVCITWHLPDSVMASAFSIYSFVRNNQECSAECQGTNNLIGCDDGSQEESGPDYVTTSGNYFLATSLNTSTNYTFYVRLYSKAASDDSNRAFCSTGVKGERNLKFKLLSSNAIELKWSEISSDIPCGNTSTKYIVQWKKEKHQMVNTSYTENLKYNISGLSPLVLYHFRVMSSFYKNEDTKWVALTLPQSEDSSTANQTEYVDFNDASVAQNAPTNPDGFRATKVSAKSVTLNWQVPNENPKFYVICYVEIDEEEEDPKRCEDGSTVKSLSNLKQIDDLKPNSLYEFRIRAHNAEGYYGPFSLPIEVRTHPDVPSTVLDLKYRIINESTACLAWLPPLYTNGKIVNYVVSYTPDPNCPLEEWFRIDVPSGQSSNLSCWFDGDEKTVSAILVNLKKSEEYTVIVRAGSDNGLSNPTFPFLLKTVNKRRVTYQRTDSIEDIANRQKMGVIAGCILALICIGCCVCCIILRRRCVKRRNLTHARLAASNNYYPAIARYATGNSTIQVRLENTCSADLHEIQNLVNDETNVEIPPAVVHLDTKGRDSLPNGHINGLKKPSNGHVGVNGHVHITENPQFDRNDKTMEIIHAKTLFPLFQDDPNSNRIQAPKLRHHFLDLSPKKKHKCVRRFDAKNLFNETLDDDNFTFPNKDLDLDVTQLTCLDDTFIIGNHRRISPLLGPNG